MPHHAPLFRYLRDCYRDDHRSGALLDVFASNVEARFVTPSAFRIAFDADRPQDFVPFSHVRQQKLAQRAWLGWGEKEPLLGRFFLAGHLGAGGIRLCAPLWTWEVVRRSGADGVEPRRASVNLALLRALLESERGALVPSEGPEEDGDSSWADETGEVHGDGIVEEVEAELDALLHRLPELPSTRADLDQAAAVLEERFGIPRDFVTSKVSDADALQRLATRTRELAWVPCELLLLRRRSIDSRGVLTELGRLAETCVPSEALRRVLESKPGTRTRPRRRRMRRINAPATLSGPQKTAIRNAETETLSLVIGPPGTGKSFTIAATALDALSRGESVLVVAKTHHAVDVVADKLESMLGLGEWVVRGGRSDYRRALADRLDRWLEGNLPPFGEDSRERRRLGKEVSRLERQITSLERQLRRRSRLEVEWGARQFEAASGVDAGWWRDTWRSWRLARTQAELEDSPPYWRLMDSYRLAVERRIERLAELLRHRVVARLRHALARDRASLARLRQSVTARSVRTRQGHFSDLDLELLLHAAPVWMVKTPEAAQVLPLQRHLFDLVIFDEATQSDMASALPLVQRARRCQVVGDPRQLRHLSFLSRRHQRRLAEQRALGEPSVRRFDYRDVSFLDLVNQILADQRQVVFLDEHFRSVPAIIEFSNREFYGSRLRVMQEHPAQRFHQALELRRVEGTRRAQGDNPQEVQALVDDVVDLVRRQAGEPDELCHSVGVLSPLRAQVEALTSALTRELSDREIRRHDLRVATAYGFQGEERDVMFLSLAVDADSHPSALRYLQRADVFNVAVTRARVRQVVYTSLSTDDEPEGLLGRYLEHVRRGSALPDAAPSSDDGFLREVQSRLELDGARVWPEYSVAGMRVDLVVEKDGRCVGIDLVGYPGRFAGSFDLERYRIFNRAGLRLMPLPYFAWRRDGAACVRAVEELLGVADAAGRR